VTEVVHPLDDDVVALRPCPSWCIETRQFADGEAIYADHGYHPMGRRQAHDNGERSTMLELLLTMGRALTALTWTATVGMAHWAPIRRIFQRELQSPNCNASLGEAADHVLDRRY
jgi:hypothetical protein